jgi:hypothetical protein
MPFIFKIRKYEGYEWRAQRRKRKAGRGNERDQRFARQSVARASGKLSMRAKHFFCHASPALDSLCIPRMMMTGDASPKWFSVNLPRRYFAAGADYTVFCLNETGVHRSLESACLLANRKAGKSPSCKFEVAQMFRTLLVDNYDSYTYNLYHQIAAVSSVPPAVVANDRATVQSVRAVQTDSALAETCSET